jgi:sugar lactone lactonase YvrE
MRTQPDRVELVVDAHASVGEGPVWDAGRGVLWWVDITAGLVHRFDPHEGIDAAILVGASVGCVALRGDGSLLVALPDRLSVLDPERGTVEKLLDLPDGQGIRSNDGKCDPAGRLWLGRMADNATAGRGSLLRVDPDLAVVPVTSGLTIPNGLGWSEDGRTMYFVDSPCCEVRRYEYDLATGRMGDGRRLIAFPDDGSVPDGLTLDAEGCIWVARWAAGCVVRVAPDGELLERIDFPVSQTTSCAFGGDDLGDLYVTSAHEDFGPGDFAREPLAGGLFRCRPGVGGHAPARFGAAS